MEEGLDRLPLDFGLRLCLLRFCPSSVTLRLSSDDDNHDNEDENDDDDGDHNNDNDEGVGFIKRHLLVPSLLYVDNRLRSFGSVRFGPVRIDSAFLPLFLPSLLRVDFFRSAIGYV